MCVHRRREQDASDRDRQRYKNQLDVTGSEKGQLEKLRLQLTEQVRSQGYHYLLNLKWFGFLFF